jgi:hypothetical protein
VDIHVLAGCRGKVRDAERACFGGPVGVEQGPQSTAYVADGQAVEFGDAAGLEESHSEVVPDRFEANR